MSRDFTTVITDLGVCYTFNGKNQALTVRKPGLLKLKQLSKGNMYKYTCSLINPETNLFAILLIVFLEGTANSLNLVLNIEQYEHMRGPQQDAGVKVGVL